MALDPTGEATLADQCRRNGLVLVDQVPTHVGTLNDPTARPDTLTVTADPSGVGLGCGVSGAAMSCDEALQLADALFDAAMASRQLRREAPMLAHARRVVNETLGPILP